jgi:hypothetical protein
MAPLLQAALVSATASGSSSPLLDVLYSLKSSPLAVGSAWMVSSAVFTTYSTTKFLKYSPERNYSTLPTTTLKHYRKHQQQQQQQRLQGLSLLHLLPRASVLTLYRFAGSLFLGLFLHLNLGVMERLRVTLAAAPALALPAAFLFIANFSNS